MTIYSEALSPTNKQAEGIAALAALITVLYAIRLLASLLSFPSPVSVPFGVQESGFLAVALNFGGEEKGIFFMPPGTMVADLLRAEKYDFSGKFQEPITGRKLKGGDKITVSDKAVAVLTMEKLSAVELLALDLPLDINSATFDDMLLVPGIGDKTALQFISLRKRKGSIDSLESLMEIKGVKGKKFAKLKKYFTTNF